MKKLIKVLKFIFTDRQTLGYFTYALLVLGLLFLLTFAVYYPLMRQARLVANDTLPGLIYGAEVNSTLDDNFIRVLMMADPQFAAERDDLIRQIEQDTRKNEEVIRQYQKYIYDEEDRRSFESFATERNRFLAARKEFFGQLHRQPEEAMNAVKTTLLPAYQKYRDAGRNLIKYNERLGQERSGKILSYSFYTILFNLIAPVLGILGAIVLGIRIFRL